MVDQNVIDMIKDYIHRLAEEGIEIRKAILFGSCARGTMKDDSDIDLLLVSPLFDKSSDEYMGRIWRLTKVSNYRIEPMAVGDKQFIEDDISPVLEMARREGIEIRV